MRHLVLFCLLALCGVCYQAAPLLRPSARRRREARSLRTHVLREVRAGHRSEDDAVVRDVLEWCEAVVRTGRDLPLVTRPRTPARDLPHQ